VYLTKSFFIISIIIISVLRESIKSAVVFVKCYCCKTFHSPKHFCLS